LPPFFDLPGGIFSQLFFYAAVGLTTERRGRGGLSFSECERKEDALLRGTTMEVGEGGIVLVSSFPDECRQWKPS